MPRVALVTFDPTIEKLPERTVRMAEEENGRLRNALDAARVRADVVAWTDPRVGWADYDLVLVRTTWGYERDLAGFIGWFRSVSEWTTLLNPPKVLEWNADKRYLLDLKAHGVPIPPTVHFKRGAKVDLGEVCRDKGWDEVVVKRAVTAGGRGQARVARKEADTTGQEHLDRLLAAGDALVQPFLPSILSTGERSIVLFGGAFSHAVRKVPKDGYLAHTGYGAVATAHRPTRAEMEVVTKALAAVSEPVLYARADLVDLEDGTPGIMELELIEPYLFTKEDPGAVARYAATIQKAVAHT